MNDLQEFFEKKEELVKDLLYTSNFDIDFHEKIARFINGLEPKHWYILKGEGYRFIHILTQVFLDNADSDRHHYLRLIKLNCPPELFPEVLFEIRKSSIFPFVYNGLT